MSGFSDVLVRFIVDSLMPLVSLRSVTCTATGATRPESLKVAMASTDYIDVIADNYAFCESLVDLILDRWERFHHPVYSAGLLLCPNNIGFVREMKTNDEEEFDVVKSETVDVCENIFRRWAPKSKKARPESLDADDPEVIARNRAKTRSKLRYALNHALAFVGAEINDDSLSKRSGVPWSEQVKKLNAFMIVSDNEERYLEKMEEQWRKELEKDASGTKEEDAVANDVSESDQMVEDEVEVEQVRNVSLSRSGRRRKARTFGHGFGRLDNDGGLNG